MSSFEFGHPFKLKLLAGCTPLFLVLMPRVRRSLLATWRPEMKVQPVVDDSEWVASLSSSPSSALGILMSYISRHGLGLAMYLAALAGL